MQERRELAPRRLRHESNNLLLRLQRLLDVGLLVEVHPEAAHGVVHAGEDLHGNFAGVVANELLVDLEDAF